MLRNCGFFVYLPIILVCRSQGVIKYLWHYLQIVYKSYRQDVIDYKIDGVYQGGWRKVRKMLFKYTIFMAKIAFLTSFVCYENNIFIGFDILQLLTIEVFDMT